MKNRKQKIIDLSTILVHLISILILSFMAAGALRQNNLNMLKLRDAVFIADKSGIGVEESLRSLRNYVSGHMNTELPKLGSEKAIQLKYSYDRKVSEELKRFQDESAAVSAKAKSSCTSLKTELLKVDCEQAYIKSHPVNPVADIHPEEYSIEFVSPVWSFDLAGWLIISAAGICLLFIARIVAIKSANGRIKKLYK